MKVRLMMPQAGIQASVTAVDREGNEVEIAYIDIEPYFYRRDERPPLAFAEVLHNGKVLGRASLVVSGTTGQLGLAHRKKPVKPRFEIEAEQSEESQASQAPAKQEKPDSLDEIPLPPQ